MLSMPEGATNTILSLRRIEPSAFRFVALAPPRCPAVRRPAPTLAFSIRVLYSKDFRKWDKRYFRPQKLENIKFIVG